MGFESGGRPEQSTFCRQTKRPEWPVGGEWFKVAVGSGAALCLPPLAYLFWLQRFAHHLGTPGQETAEPSLLVRPTSPFERNLRSSPCQSIFQRKRLRCAQIVGTRSE